MDHGYMIPLTETEVNLIDNELEAELRAEYGGPAQEIEDITTMPPANFNAPVDKVQTIQGIMRKLKNRNLYLDIAHISKREKSE